MKKYIYLNYTFYLFIVVIIFSSCKRDKGYIPNSSAFIEINLDKLSVIDTLSFSKIFDNVTFITLSDSNLIGEISKIIIHDNNLFVLDKISNSVAVFNEKGDYLKKFGSKGAGPGEMISAFDMTIDKENNYIYISDIHTRKINKYNIEDGKFQYSISLPINIPSYSYIFHTHDTIYLTQCDPSKNELEHLFMVFPLSEGTPHTIIPTSYNKGWDNILANYNGTFLSKSDGSLLLSHIFMDTIYEVSHKKIKPYLVLNANKENTFVSKDLLDLDVNNNPMDMVKILSSNKYFDIHNFIDTNDYIFFKVYKGSKIENVLYNKISSTSERIKLISEDILFDNIKLSHTPLNYAEKHNKLIIYYVKPNDVEKLIGITDQIKDFTFLKYIKSLKDSDSFNGLIIFYNLR